jgi:uncharacterized protein
MVELLRVETERISLIWNGPNRGSPPNRAAGRLHIIPRRPDLALLNGTRRSGIPDEEAQDLEQVAGPPLFEETTYNLFLSSRDGATVELRHRDPVLLDNLHNAQEGQSVHGTVNFRSQVGLSRFSVLANGHPELDFEVEVFPSKVNYRSDYTAMLEDVHSLAAGLALEHLRATHRLGAATGGRSSSRLEWIALLRHLVSDIERAMHHVSQHPVRALQREHHLVRAELLRRSDGRLRQAVRSGRGQGPSIQLRNGVSVRHRLPELRPTPTLDTLEHRWLALQLQRIRRELARITQEEHRRIRLAGKPRNRNGDPSARDEQALEELEQLENRIARLERLEPIVECKGPPPPEFASLQLQGAPGYKEAYRNLTILRQGLSIRGGPVELSVKDIHLLYEYWCFLGLVQAVADILNTTIPVSGLIEVRDEGLRVRLQRGRTQSIPFKLPGGRCLEVTYNPTFQDTDVLLPQQPDFVLTFTDPHWPTVRLVLDAKYRINDDPEFVARFGAPGPPSDAVNVLHRYRDAILESGNDEKEVRSGSSLTRSKRTVVEGAALYPLGADKAENFDTSRFWTSLRRLGIGALPFLPGSTHWFKQWLKDTLLRCGWAVSDAVIPHTTEVRRAYWQQAAQNVILVAVLRGGLEREHLAWIQQNQCYYTRVTPSQPRQMRAKAIAFYLPNRAYDKSTSGAVTHWAEIEEIAVCRRNEIVTPWTSRGGSEELQVLYRLQPVQELPQRIVNHTSSGGGQRFSTNRWSSRLALMRAENITELLLESAPEWELYEAISAIGLPLELQAIPPIRGNLQGNSGRVWFRIQNYIARYTGGKYFEFALNGAQPKTVTISSILDRLAASTRHATKD